MAIITTGHAEVLSALHSNAALHAQISDGFFVVDPLDFRTISPELTLHSTGSTTNRRAVSNRIDHTLLGATANLVDSRYSSLAEDEPDSRNTLALDNMATQVSNGENIGIAQKHGETRDIAFNLGRITISLSERDAQHRTGIFLSKAIDFMRIDTRKFGYNDSDVDSFLMGIGLTAREDRTVAVRDFIGVVADYTYFVFPSSKTFENLRESHERRIKRFNGSSLELVEKDLLATGTKSGEGVIHPLVLASAATGTVEKQLDIDSYRSGMEIEGSFETVPENPAVEAYETVKVIGSISEGIAHYLKHCVTYGSGIVLQQGVSRIDVNPRFKYIRGPEDMPELRSTLSETLTALHPNTLFLQDIRGNLPIQATDSPIASE